MPDAPSASAASGGAALPSAAAAASAQPLYVLGSGVAGTDDDTSYLTPLSSLAAGVEVDYSRSLEQPGVGRLYGEEGVGFFALGVEESERITRYDVSERGTFTEGPGLSLLGAGVTEMAEPYAVVFVSPTKAYYLDVAQLQVLIWNPAEMTLTGRIDLGELARDGSLPSFSVRPVQRDGQLVFAAGWLDQDASGVQPGMALVSIDTRSDALLIQPADERCRDPGEVSLAADGSIYVFSNFTNALGRLGTGHGADDCVLRVLPGESQFDPAYVGSIAPAAGGAVSIGVVQRDANTLWALVLDSDLAAFGPGITFDDFFGTPAWRWKK